MIKALESEGKAKPGLTFHGLRRTLVSDATDKGASSKQIQAILGDRSSSMSDLYADQANKKSMTSAVVPKLERLRNRKTDNPKD